MKISFQLGSELQKTSHACPSYSLKAERQAKYLDFRKPMKTFVGEDIDLTSCRLGSLESSAGLSYLPSTRSCSRCNSNSAISCHIKVVVEVVVVPYFSCQSSSSAISSQIKVIVEVVVVPYPRCLS